ncbi:MAG: trypsin-like peptidase domain-containing protein [Luteolibacter sp.]
MTTFIQVIFRNRHSLLMAFGCALIPGLHAASETQIPDYATKGDFSAEQRELLAVKQDELGGTLAKINLTHAKIEALKAKIESQKITIAALTAKLGDKVPPNTPQMDDSGKERLPNGFIAGVTPRIVIIEGDKGNGTGFLCRSGNEVWVYTAAHVLSGNRTITVRDNTGRTYRDFEFLECAEGVDLVRLKPKDTGLEGLELVLPDEAPKVGEVIVAIGNSLGAGSLTGEPGNIMSVQDDMWEVNAEIIPGNSGGPVISYESGKVVGIVTHLTINRDRDPSAPVAVDRKTEVKRFAARLDKNWEWRRMPVARFVKEWEHIEAMDKASSIAWASAYLMHTGPESGGGSRSRTDPEQVRLAESILARDRNHMQVQRVDDWLKRYRAAGTVRQGELIKEGNTIIDRNLDEIRVKDQGPKAADFSWYHRQTYEAELAFRKRLTKEDP